MSSFILSKLFIWPENPKNPVQKMAVDPNLKYDKEGGEGGVPEEVVFVDLALASAQPTNADAAWGDAVFTTAIENQQQLQNGTGGADFPGLSALRNAIGAIGDAMAELAETSAQRFRQAIGGGGGQQAEEEQQHLIGDQDQRQSFEERVENVSLAAASETGLATTAEGSHQKCGEQPAAGGECRVAALLNEPVGAGGVEGSAGEAEIEAMDE